MKDHTKSSIIVTLIPVMCIVALGINSIFIARERDQLKDALEIAKAELVTCNAPPACTVGQIMYCAPNATWSTVRPEVTQPTQPPTEQTQPEQPPHAQHNH